MNTTIHKQGKLRGEKVQYPDGVGLCVWYPLPPTDPNDEEDSGICFDVAAVDLDDLINLLLELREAQADVYEETEEVESEPE
jgi:hypothetical protein